jgi:HAD superfamily hydrolase (TIGR01458 family)
MGIAIEVQSIVTPVIAAEQWLSQHVKGDIALFIPEATREDLEEVTQLPGENDQGAEAVVVGDMGEQWDFHLLNRAFRLLMADPATQLLALGMTRYWRAEDGLRLDVAPFVKALEYATDKQAVVVGKPSREFFSMCLSMLGLESGQVFMIGDDIRSDIGAAQQSGIWGVLVRTGKFQESDLDSDIAPDVILDSIAQLPDWLQGIQA